MKFLKDQPDEKLLKKNAVEKKISWDLDDVDDDDDNEKENDENEKNQKKQNVSAFQQVPKFPEQSAPELKKIRELVRNDFFINHEDYTPPTNQTAEKSKKRKKNKKIPLNLINQHVGARALGSPTIDISLIKI